MRKAAILLVAGLMTQAHAAGLLDAIKEMSAEACGAIQLFTGPVVWILVFLALAIAAIIITVGGRNWSRWVIAPAAAILLLVGGMAWFKSLIKDPTVKTQVTQCLSGQSLGP